MYVFSNALKNLKRNKGRNILVSILIVIIILSTSISIIINTTTASIIKNHKDKFGVRVSMELDHKRLIKNGNVEVKGPTGNELLQFGKSKYIKSAEYEGVVHGVFPQEYKSPYTKQNENSAKKVNAYLKGSQNKHIDSFFEQGTYKIIKGRKYQKNGECIISKDFARKNKINIGDALPINIKNKGFLSDSTVPMKLIVSGIYNDYSNMGLSKEDLKKINDKVKSKEPMYIYTSLDTMINMKMLNMDGETDLLESFYLKDPSMLKEFTKELRNQGLSDYFLVKIDEEAYKQIVGPVEGMNSITKTFTAVVMFIGCTVLLIISIISIRERKYEIGVLRAMGMSKSKISLGFLFESTIVTLLCLVIGLSISVSTSQAVADKLFESQVSATKSSNNMQVIGGGAEGMVYDNASNTNTIDKVSVILTPSTMINISFIVFLLIISSSTVSILYVTRFEPMKILSERD